MNRRRYREKQVKISEELLTVRQRECVAYERKIEFDMATKQKDTIMDIVKATMKIVKLEIKELLKKE